MKKQTGLTFSMLHSSFLTYLFYLFFFKEETMIVVVDLGQDKGFQLFFSVITHEKE